MATILSPDSLVQQLQWRYATKQFDPEQKLTAAQVDALQDALVLSPSSFGLQPWKFFWIEKQDVKDSLKGKSWGQGQVSDCSALVVLAHHRGITDADVKRFIVETAKVRQVDPTTLDGYHQVISGFLEKMTPEQLDAWAQRQSYIALGQLMTAAAAIGVDTCPLEGIDPDGYDRLLNLGDTNYRTSVACALGFRAQTDKYAAAPKVRYQKPDVLKVI